MGTYKYPVKVYQNSESGWIVEFRDIPEAKNEIWSKDELQKTGLNCLISAMECYVEDNRKFPEASEGHTGNCYVSVPASAIAKIFCQIP